MRLIFHTTIKLHACTDVLKTLRTAHSIKIFKTWVNGWCTSHRFHDPVRCPCLFGCTAKPDDMSHFIMRPHLYALGLFFRGHLSSDPLVRLGLVKPQTEHYRHMCCVFDGFHAMRHAIRSGSIEVSSNMDLSSRQVWRLWSVFAEAYSAEAREHAICFRRFSLPEFISFLNEDR